MELAHVVTVLFILSISRSNPFISQTHIHQYQEQFFEDHRIISSLMMVDDVVTIASPHNMRSCVRVGVYAIWVDFIILLYCEIDIIIEISSIFQKLQPHGINLWIAFSYQICWEKVRFEIKTRAWGLDTKSEQSRFLRGIIFGALLYNCIDIIDMDNPLTSGLISRNLPNGFAYFLFLCNSSLVKLVHTTKNWEIWLGRS